MARTDGEAPVERLVRLVQQACARGSAGDVVVALIGAFDGCVIGLVPEPLIKETSVFATAICRAAADQGVAVVVGIG